MTARADKILVLDVDGVVVHPGSPSQRSNVPWTAQLERDLGIPPSVLVKRFFAQDAGRSVSLMESCSIGEMAVEDALSAVLIQIGFSGGVETVLQYWFEHDSHVDRNLLALVAQLRDEVGLKCYLATSQEHRRASYLWNDLGLSNHFEGMFYSARVGFSKKTPAFYQAVGETIGIRGADSVYFDDRPEFVQYAASAGWASSLYESPACIAAHPTVTRWRSEAPRPKLGLGTGHK
ncbi:HAD family hydrolase [Luteibacter rhizovicinus]|nr:HAD-IA family hydrolase [Luteibacter rhizovicinus]